MYGFKTVEDANTRCATLAIQHPENRYEVARHKHPERSLWGREDKTETWGVKRYVSYVPQMPWRFDGFVWFS